MIHKITSLVVALIGAALLYMGAHLLAAGGTPFYAVQGVVFLLVAVLLLLRRRVALTLYALLMWATLLWIIAEVGFDKWQWIPRGDLIGLVGLWLALPWVVRPLSAGQPAAQSPRRSHPFLGGTVAVMVLIVIGLMFYDPLPQAGRIDNAKVVSEVDAAGADWAAYGGTDAGQRFSTLDQINVGNVKGLEVAWRYQTGDLRDAATDASEYTFESTPLKVNDTVYLCTPHNDVHALDPVTGALKWKYSAPRDPSYLQQHQTCRGVSYLDTAALDASASAGATAPDAACSKRIYQATADAKLIALDADTGKACAGFGNDGVIDLSRNMGTIRPHALMQTSAPLVAGNLVIVGGSVMDNGYQRGNPSGVIRAFDALSGQLVWNFDAGHPDNTQPIAADANYPYDTPVAWATLSADVKNGLVYVPFGNASPDEIGIGRDPASSTENLRDALVALDLKSGQFKWRFQSSNHDLWDRDNPSQPSLFDLHYQGQQAPAVVLPTKTGNLFVLNRLTGEPIYPVTQQPVSTDGGVPGETPAATQPVSALSFIPDPLTEQSMWGISPFDQMACRIDFKSMRYDGNPWTPATEHGSIVFPGNIGVFNWGSVAIDPQRQILVAAPVRLAYKYNLIPRTPETEDKRLFTQDGQPYWNENFQGDYAIRIQQFSSSLGIPCVAPPWGRMAGVDLTTGKTTWLRRVGTTKNLKTNFLPFRFPVGFPMGMVAHGGPLITAGGVVFHGATADNFFRAYDVNTGELLWQTELDAGAQATPSTYLGSDQRQYVVIAAGGHGSLGTKLGDTVVAYRVKQ